MVTQTEWTTINRAGGRCKFCASYRVVKNGKRKGTQYWLCRDCGRGFVDNRALPKMKFPVDTIAAAVRQYYTGASLTQIRDTVEHSCNVRPAYSAIYGWTARLTGIAQDETPKYKPDVSDIWVVNEAIMSVAGGDYWLFDIIDTGTRYLIASRLSAARSAAEIKKLMQAAADRTGKMPAIVITNGWQGYADGIEMAFSADPGNVPGKPLVDRDFKGLIKLFQESLKDRTSVMRGFRKPETARLIMEGWLIHYNYFRPQESLGNRTPAEAAGIKFPYGEWLDVLKSQIPLYHRDWMKSHLVYPTARNP